MCLNMRLIWQQQLSKVAHQRNAYAHVPAWRIRNILLPVFQMPQHKHVSVHYCSIDKQIIIATLTTTVFKPWKSSNKQRKKCIISISFVNLALRITRNVYCVKILTFSLTPPTLLMMMLLMATRNVRKNWFIGFARHQDLCEIFDSFYLRHNGKTTTISASPTDAITYLVKVK